MRAFSGASGHVLADSPIGKYVAGMLEKMGAPDHYVEVRIFPTRSSMRAALAQELENSVPSESPAIPDFATFHEAFAGYPRIWVSMDETNLGDPVSRARLQHEVGHAVLHWEISSYLVGIPEALTELAQAQIIDTRESSMISYLLSIGVKDFEVSFLLNGLGIRADQILFYIQELDLPPHTPEDLPDMLNELKVILAACPFRDDERIRLSIERTLEAFKAFQELARLIITDLEEHTDLALIEKMGLSARRCQGFLEARKTMR